MTVACSRVSSMSVRDVIASAGEWREVSHSGSAPCRRRGAGGRAAPSGPAEPQEPKSQSQKGPKRRRRGRRGEFSTTLGIDGNLATFHVHVTVMITVRPFQCPVAVRSARRTPLANSQSFNFYIIYCSTYMHGVICLFEPTFVYATIGFK
jgi:hypothetical protein